MATNDTIIIDSIIEQRLGSPDLSDVERGEAFQRISIEKLLKKSTPSPEEIDYGIVDGSDDGGIDGFFITVNGRLMADIDSVQWPKKGIELEVWILTCKHQDTYRQAPLDNLCSTLAELLDFRLLNDDLKGQYSEVVLRRRLDLMYAYKRAAHAISLFQINIGYISRGDTRRIGSSIVARSVQLKSTVSELFGGRNVRFDFYGAAEIVELYRQDHGPRLRIKFLEMLPRENSYLLLVNLKELAVFVGGDDGTVRQDLLDSNVRDFMGLNPVNFDIRNTLIDDRSPEFWWLNNGITILATDAAVIGKEISLEDIQIVNGLQTTESIFRHFQEHPDSANEGSVLVKVIQSSDDSVRDAIIRSTNNQTAVDAASLYATDKVQRDIEEVLKPHGFYYERRKNYYANRGVSTAEIITPLYLGAGYVALGLKNPKKAASFGNGAIRNKSVYEIVFGHEHDIQVWISVAVVMRLVERTLRRYWRERNGLGRFIRSWRHIVAFLFVARTLRGFTYSANQLATVSCDALDDALVTDTVDIIWRCKSNRRKRSSWNSAETESAICTVASVCDLNDLSDWQPISWPNDLGGLPSLVDLDFAMKVDRILPEQPWKPGIHRALARQLNRSPTAVHNAIVLLIKHKIRNQQENGVVYDDEGNVICVDQSRV